MKNLFLFIAGLLLLLCSCSKEQPVFKKNLCPPGICMEFDVVTHKRVMPSNPQDTELLSISEKSLMVPEVTKAKVKFNIDTAGTFSGEMQILPNGINYPDNMLGRQKLPQEYQLSKMVFSNNSVTYFDNKNQVIVADHYCNKIALYYQTLVENLSDHVTVDADRFAQLMEGFRRAGFTVSDRDDKFHVINVPLPDGRRSELLIDKEKQMVVGNANYTSNGELISNSLTYTKGTATNPGEIHHRFMTPIISPINDVNMEVVHESQLTDISLTINN